MKAYALKRALAVIVVIALAACEPTVADDGRAPLPVLPDGPVTLRVAHVVNPRLPRVTDAELALLLDQTRRTVREHFGIAVEFTASETIDIADVFAPIAKQYGARMDAGIVDPDAPDRDRLHGAMVRAVDRSGYAAVAEYARPFLVSPPDGPGTGPLARALAETLLAGLERWRAAMPGGDGPYREWVYWDNLGRGELPWDVIITNQLVASAEYYALSIHASLRGGLTVGTTSRSRNGQFGAFSWISTLPLAAEPALLADMRGGERYGADEAAKLAGAYLAHEIGHLLLHLGHPFDNPACVMTPTASLRFREWFKGLDADKCPVGGSKAMEPGVATIAWGPL